MRTLHQDTWANLIETWSRTAFPGLKFGQGPAELREFLFDYAEITAQEDLGLASSEETLARVKERAIKLIKLRGSDEP